MQFHAPPSSRRLGSGCLALFLWEAKNKVISHGAINQYLRKVCVFLAVSHVGSRVEPSFGLT